MNDVIEKFYKDNDIMPLLLEQKLRLFGKNRDIAEEFEYWIQTGKYVSNNPVIIEGYTAAKLAEEVENLEGEGAFIVLTELRDDPQRAMNKIKEGYKKK